MLRSGVSGDSHIGLASNCLPVFPPMNGAQIRAARERRGWTQADLASAIGVGQRTVGAWERGETVPKNRMAMLDQVLGLDSGQNGNGNGETTMRSDADLLAEAQQILSELTRRALRRTS